jgi:UDP-2,4-diacetamido-2,4,6-trideoxy-beta-L-altropyranose hydrolase
MKVLILTEGSSNIGFGHITRTLSLAQALREKGFEVCFTIYGDETVNKILNGENFFYRLHNWIKDLPELETYDVVIVDSYKAPYGVYKEISTRAKVKLFIDDYWRLEYPPGFVLNFTPNFKRDNLPEGVKPLFGIKYHLLRKPFWDVSGKRINQKVEKVLVTLGGDDLRNLTPLGIKCAFDIFPNTEVITVIGGGFKKTERIERLKEVYGEKLKFIRNATAKQMRDLMLQSDIAICAGGQTLFELARVGTPPVVVEVADNQRRNIKGFSQLGFIYFAGAWKVENLEQLIKEGLKTLAPYEERLKRYNLGRQLVDGKGARRVAEILAKSI